MSKNLTRKGLALGALVALASSVFAGAPAQAANEINFVPNAGTAFAISTTGTFTLKAGLPSGSTGDISQLRYKVSTTGSLPVAAVSSVKLANAAAVNSAVVNGPGDTAANAVSAGVKSVTNAAAVYVSGTADVNTVDTVADPDTYTHAFTAPTSTSLNTLALSLTGGAYDSTTQTVTVTAFLDSTPDGTFDSATEWSTTQTVTFVKYSELTVTGTIVAPIAGDLKVTANWKFGNINNEQVTTARVKSAITKGDGTQLQDDPADDTVSAAAWDATDLFKVVNDGAANAWTSDAAGLAKGSAVKVQAILNDGTTDRNVGTALTANVTSRKLTTWTADTVTSTTALAATAALQVAATDVARNTEFQVVFEGLDADLAAVAGVPVTIKVTSPDNALSTTAFITINGTSYTARTALPGATGVAQLAAVTDAKGRVTVTIKATGLTAGNDIRVYATAENFTADIITNQADATFTTSYIANAPHGVATTTDGTPVALDVVVKDQFGGNAPDSTYKVVAAWDATGAYSAQTTTPSTALTATEGAVTGGKATLTITDNGTGTGVHNYDITLQKKSAVTGLFSDVADISLDFNIKIVAAASAAPGAIVLSAANTYAEAGTASATDLTYVLGAVVGGDTLAALSTKAFATADSRNVIDAVPTETSTPVTVYGTVKSASTSTYAGVAIANAPVTISGAGMLFKNTGENQGTLWGDGKLSLYANASGQFSFTVAGHLHGKQTVTVTSAAGTAKLYVYFAEAAESAAKTVTVKVADGASQFQAGRALDVVFTVTDQYGNPVAIDTTYAVANGADAADVANSKLAKVVIAQTGAGYLSLSGAQATGAAGTFTSKLITNFGDLGTSNITATVDFYDPTKTDIVATNSSEFGVTDADVTVGGRAVYASVEFAKGKTVTVSVDGRRLYSKLFTTDAYTELKFTQKTAGKHVVTVRISGGIVYSESVVTTK